jgi:nucleoside-diphosphate-sugar epimerase
MKILITGAAGFIGSNLAKFFDDRKYELVLLDNLEYGYLDNLDSANLKSKLIVTDIRKVIDPDLVEGVDVVYHFAGISSLPECQANPIKAIDVNVNGTINILEAARKSGVKKFIFASTSAIYENSHLIPFSEQHETNPDLIYSQSKKMSEEIVKSYYLNYGMKSIICRFFNVYGANQDFRRKNPPFTSYIVKQALSNESLMLFNSNNVKRDYIYISDLIDILQEFLVLDIYGNPNDLTYNLCSGLSYSPTDIIQILSKILRKDLRIVQGKPEEYWMKYPELFGENGMKHSRIEKEIMKVSIGSNKKIVDLIGKNIFISMEKGLKEIVNYQNRPTL